MEIPVLNYEIHENLASCRDFFQKLKLFSIAQGWTLKREEISKQWASIGGGQYGFVAGTQDYMELFSVGHGRQYLNFRFLCRNDSATDAQDFWIRGHRYDTYKTTVSTPPVDINAAESAWNDIGKYSGFHSIKKSNIPALWLFGNSKFICWVMQCSSTYLVYGYFGSPNLFYADETNMAFLSRAYPNTGSWLNLNLYSVFDQGLDVGMLVNNITTYNLNHVRYNYTSDWTNSCFYPMSHLMKKNAVSNVRPIAPHLFYVKNADLTRWYCPGTLWIGKLVFDGLSIGQKLKYGSEEYIVFPITTLSHYYGNAFRIN